MNPKLTDLRVGLHHHILRRRPAPPPSGFHPMAARGQRRGAVARAAVLQVDRAAHTWVKLRLTVSASSLRPPPGGGGNSESQQSRKQWRFSHVMPPRNTKRHVTSSGAPREMFFFQVMWTLFTDLTRPLKRVFLAVPSGPFTCERMLPSLWSRMGGDGGASSPSAGS